MRSYLIAAGLAATAAVSLAFAANAKTTMTPLADSGVWSATQFNYDDGTMSCAVGATSGDARIIIGVAPGEDRIKLLVRYGNWSAPKPFLTGLDIGFDGTDRWHTSDRGAAVEGNTVKVKIPLAVSAEFVHAFTTGASMQLAIYGATPITVGLTGTPAVWGSFMDCVRRVSPTVVASIVNPTAFASAAPTAPLPPSTPVMQPAVSEVGLLTNSGVKHVRGVAGSETAILFVLDSGASSVQIPRATAGQLALEGALIPTGRKRPSLMPTAERRSSLSTFCDR